MPNYHPIARNRRATYDYEIKERLLAGVVLRGPEVKSVRAGHVSLKGAFANFHNNELWLNNVHISPYPPAHDQPQDPDRTRKLLLHKKQIDQLNSQKQSGLQIVVCSIGLSGPYIKVELGIGHSKKRHDKRETIKRRQASREAQRSIKNRTGLN